MNFLTYNIFELGRKKDLYKNGMFNADEPMLNTLVAKRTKYDIDRDTKNIKEIASGYIYQLEVLMKNERLVYIGSTKNPKHRFKAHVHNLKKRKHHNKSLQNLYKEDEVDKFKFSIIKTVEEYEISTLVAQENDLVVEIASRYHNTLDSKCRKIIVVYSR